MLNKRLINFRPIFFLFIVLLITIFTFVYINLSPFYLFLLLIPILFFILLLYKRKFIFFSISIVLVLICSLVSFFNVAQCSKQQFVNTYAVVNADIESINKVNENFYYLTLLNCIVTTQTDANLKLDGKISLEFSVYDDNVKFNQGDKIVFASNLNSQSLFDEYDQLNTFFINQNIRYTSKISYSQDVKFFNQDKSFVQKIKDYNQNLLIQHFGQTHGNLAFSLLFGDKQNNDDQIMQVFKLSGVMHIFSVSGLHVGLIVAILFFILSKMPINKYLKFAITAMFLLVYCLLCSFSAPVFRATIMCLVVLFAKLFYKKPDSVNSFSVAGIILLILNPLTLFNGGFQMSFIAVFGIIFFSGLFKKINVKNKLLKQIILFVGVSISTTLAMLPILAKFYGFLATWSLLSNLITLPLFSIFYPVLFVANLIVLIMPFMSFLYIIPKAFLDVLIYLNQLVLALPYGVIKIKDMGLVASIFYYAAIFCISKYLIVKTIYKTLLSLSLLVISLTSWYVFSLPKINNQNSVILCSGSLSSATLLTTRDNKYYLINPDLTKTTELKNWLEYQKIDCFDAVIITKSKDLEAKKLYLFLQDFDVLNIYLPENSQTYLNLQQLGLKCTKVDSMMQINDILIEYIYYDNQIVASIIKKDNFVIATIDCSNLLQSELDYLIAYKMPLDIDVAKIYNKSSDLSIEMPNVKNTFLDLSSNLTITF